MVVVLNTLTKQKEELVPRKKGKLDMFVCGPTVYDRVHVGNAKTFVQFDMIVRYLRHRGFKVEYIQNITDVDDKIIKKAQEVKKYPLVVADEFYKLFVEDMKHVGNTAVSRFAKATDHVPEIVSQVERLLKKKYAYKTSDGVYFDLSKDKEYGKLSGRTVEQAEDATSRVDASEEKRNQGDFCLWKFAKEGEPTWKAPFGAGRPGWHIEDTAIAEKFFGVQYDMHGGAVDLIFPHHEAEIAQMEAISGKKPFVRYWLHTGFLDMGKEKMSKSKGNMIMLHEMLQKYERGVVRFLFASSQYRSRMSFSENVVEQARMGLQRLNDFVQWLDKGDDEELLKDIEGMFYAAMDDDFNTPAAFAAVFDLVSECYKRNVGGKKTLDFLKKVDEVFGILEFEVKVPRDVVELAEERVKARSAREWERADTLREMILKKGYVIEDKGEGYRVKKA